MSGQKLMTKTTLIDTDILIDFGRGIPEAANCLQQLQSNSRLASLIIPQLFLERNSARSLR